MMVAAGNNGSVERIYNADERKNACWYRSYAEISPCTHPGATYTVSGTDASGTHTMHCSHCSLSFKAEEHDFDENGECGVCHFKGRVHTVTIYLPDADEEGIYTTDGVYNSTTYDMVEGTSFTLPGAPQDLHDMEFAGWLVTTAEGTLSFSSYRTSDSEELQPAGTPYTLSGDVTFVARYKDVAIRLADDSDNGWTISTYDGKENARVILDGRKLWKDGTWNTLCLPFSMTSDQVSAQLAPDELMTLESTEFENGTLTLNFANVTNIEAGKPFRAYFQLSNGLVAGDSANGINNFVLNFGGETNAIENGIMKIEKVAGAWYSPDGRKLSGKPTQKGIYIYNGQKMVIL